MNRALIVLLIIGSACAKLEGQDRLLPSDTSFLLTVNTRAALQSAALRELFVPWCKTALEKAPNFGQLANILGIDPLTELWTVSVATGSNRDQDRIIVVLRGSWDKQSLAGRLLEKSKRMASGLSLVNDNKQTPVYQWSRPGGKPGSVFIALSTDGGIVTSPAKDYLAQVLRPNEKADLSDRHFQDSIAAMNPRALAFVAVSGTSIDWSMVPEEKARDAFKSSRGLSGHLILNQAETELNLELSLEFADRETASSSSQALDDLAGQSLGYLGMLVAQHPQYKAVHTALKSNRNEAQGNSVRIRATMPLGELRELMNPKQAARGN